MLCKDYKLLRCIRKTCLIILIINVFFYYKTSFSGVLDIWTVERTFHQKAIDLLFRNNVLYYEQIRENLDIPAEYLNDIIDYIGQGIKNDDKTIKYIFNDTDNNIYKKIFESEYSQYCFYKDQYSLVAPEYHPKRYEYGQSMSTTNYYLSKDKDDIYPFTEGTVKNYQTFLMLSKLRAWSIGKIKKLASIEDHIEQFSLDIINKKRNYSAK